MPQVASLLSQMEAPLETDACAAPAPPENFPENLPLFLPSAIPRHLRTLPALHDISNLERRLREPQADDALAEVRRQRRVIQGLWQFKKLNVSGTGNKPNTKVISLYKRFDNKTKRFAQRYRTAWEALRVLDPNGAWSIRLQELKDNDIRGPGKDPNDTYTTKSQYEPSWIWLMPHLTEPNETEAGIDEEGAGEGGICEEEFNECMRVEWAKAKAHMYGNRDCQASKGFDKHVMADDADVY